MATETTAGHGIEGVQGSQLASEMAGSCVNADGGAVGLPQLCGDWMGNQIFWLIVTLVVTYFILARIALPRIASVLSERQGTVTNDLAAAEDLRARSVEAEEAYNQALADARTEAQAIIAQNKAEMQGELNEAIKRADTEIAAKTAESEKAIAEIRASALENVQQVARETAAEIVAAFGGTADEAKVSSVVNSRVKG
ncbi:F0F1 ATP synthase subunit B' [Aquicoccus sp. SCR17]|nr:F0F1 ATP synthase subunit B' [Carideicomes alvinocaridis]